jgi:hypothetical protein
MSFAEIPLKPKFGAFIFVLLLAACRAVAQPPSAATNASINGVWRCQINGLPAITLLVTDEPGSLTGAILFYFQQRTTDKNAYNAVPGLPEPIFHPQFDGKTLLFEVSHRRAHPPRTLNDAPKHFRLTLHGPNTAELVNVDEPGPACKIVRSDY